MIAADRSKYLQFVLIDSRHCEKNSFYTATDALLTLEAEVVKRQEPQAEQPERTQTQQSERLTVLEMLRKYGLGEQREHLLLAGKPGSGKSTTLQRLCVEMAAIAASDDRQPIPIFVQLKGDKPILTLIQAGFRRAKLKVTAEQIDDLLLADKLVLLLDGVNEIPSEQLRRELQDFRENNLKTPTIFTTRDLTVGGSLGIDKRLEMRPLTEEQMREFVHKYLPEYGDKLLGQLRDRLREIAETPLLLKMLCEVFEPATGRIPQNKAELFELFDLKYQIHKEGVLISADSRRFQSDILQYLAFTMLQGDAEKPTEAWLTLSRSRAEGIIEAWLKQRGETNPASKAKEWLEDLVEHHLLQVAADPQQIEFHHQLFQEYYAARHLRSMLQNQHPDLVDDDRLKHFYLNYLKWTEPLGLLLGLFDDEAQALRLVGLGLEVDRFLGARLAGQVKLGFQKHLVENINKEDLPTWLKIYLLGCTRSQEAKTPLLNFLNSNDLDVTTQAVLSLEELNNPEIVPALKARLEKLEKWIVPDPSSMPPYIEAGSKMLSAEAVKLEVTINKLLVDLSPKDVKSIVDNYLDNPAAFFEYFSVGSEMNGIIIQCAKTSQENIENRLISKLIATNSINPISQLASILSDFKNEEASVILIGKLSGTGDSQFKSGIINSIGKFDNDDSLNILFKLLCDFDFNIQSQVAKVLINNRRLNAIPLLEPILKNQDLQIRWNASTVLAELGAEIAVEVLLEGLNHEDREVRSQSAKSLGNLPVDKTKVFLVAALKDPIYFVRRSTAIALAKSGSEEAIPELLEALNDYFPDDPKLADSKFEFERNHIIQEVVDALSQFNTDEVREKLHQSLLRGDRVAAIALAQFGDVEMVPHLIEMLGSDRYSLDYLDRASILLANLIDGAQEDSKRDSFISNIISHLNAPEIDKNYYFRNRLAIVLIRVNSLHIAKYLTELIKLLDTKSGKQALWVIESVQYNCKLYSYDIFLESIPSMQPLSTESPTYNIGHVGILNTGTVNTQKQIGIQ